MVHSVNQSWQNLLKFNIRDKIDGANEFKTKTIFGIKTIINPLIPWKFGLQNEIAFECYRILQSAQVKLVIISMIVEIADPYPKLKTWVHFVSKLQCTQFL